MPLPATAELLPAPYALLIGVGYVRHLSPAGLYLVLRKVRGNGKVILYLVLQVGGIFVFGYLTEISQ